MTITVRKATTDDVPAILAFVKTLADYEKAPNEVWVNEADYRRDMANGWFHSLVAQNADTGEVVGMMLYFKSYSSWKGAMLYLDDFVVAESHRRYGVGKLLFDALIEEAKAWDVNLIKWQVLDWNTPAIAFYEKYGADFDHEWVNCRLLKPQIMAWR